MLEHNTDTLKANYLASVASMQHFGRLRRVSAIVPFWNSLAGDPSPQRPCGSARRRRRIGCGPSLDAGAAIFMSSPFHILGDSSAAGAPPPSAHPRPDWLKVRFFGGDNFQELKRIMRSLDLHTVCESARCPNQGRMLGASHRDLHDLGQYLHAGLRLLRRAFGASRGSAGGRRTRARRRRPCSR